MTTKQDIMEYIKWVKENKTIINQNPIFEIILFENICNDPNYFPDTGCEDRPGFYYELDTAIQAMNENWADIQDHAFKCGFIICRFPGLYNASFPKSRMYFEWNSKKEGFFQKKEPLAFKYLSY